jgi:hypothetical protein
MNCVFIDVYRSVALGIDSSLYDRRTDPRYVIYQPLKFVECCVLSKIKYAIRYNWISIVFQELVSKLVKEHGSICLKFLRHFHPD